MPVRRLTNQGHSHDTRNVLNFGVDLRNRVGLSLPPSLVCSMSEQTLRTKQIP